MSKNRFLEVAIKDILIPIIQSKREEFLELPFAKRLRRR
jgi:hypothetical protein